MNIAAIYDKYDLWGKVRVESRLGGYSCRIRDPGHRIERVSDTLSGAIHIALKDYIKCEPCEGDGVVPSEPYTTSGRIPDCDVVKCKKCNGTGERA